ncbi:UNVERIFIED_CONTAM: cytochrome [Sesamum latifolium]|uniref:Cytochrome n=1 Tax=Sesamum latifolium TaxID=2727402 RepID=A0AAW2TQ81_9LAMI
MLGLLFAGRDTTSTCLTWLFWLFSTNPSAQTKILEEIERELDVKEGESWRFFSIEKSSKLIYRHGALCESLRLFPPLALEYKFPVRPDTLPSGHHIRQNTKLIISFYAMGRMETIWGKDCLEFKRERWISGRGAIEHRPSNKFPAFNGEIDPLKGLHPTVVSEPGCPAPVGKRKVGKLETAKELWDILEELFTETSLPSKLFLLEKFFRYKLDLSKNIDENIDEFTKLVQDIKLTGDKNIDDYTPIVLLNAIPETYSDVKATIKYGRDNVSLDTVINGLKSKEMDIKINKTNQSSSEVNFVRGRTKNRNFNYKYRKSGRSRSRSKSRSKSRDCRKPKRDNRNNSKNDSEDANFVSDNNGEVYMISDINNVQSSVNMHEWLIDSGCSFHMSPYKEIFSNYKTDNFGFVAMANEKLCGIKGLGDVCVTFDNGYKLTLKNIRHVPDLCHNLMSCSALEEEGLEGRWGKGIMKIMKDDKASLWHRRLGHISLKGLDLLHKNGLLPDKFKDLKFCDDCVLGKQHKVHFPASPYPNSPTSNGVKGIDSGLETNQDLRTEVDYNIELTFNKVEENNEDNQQGEGFREEEADRADRNPEHTENYSLARDRERRERRIPSRFKDFHLALTIENSEPTSYDDAIKSPKSELWIKAMKEEMKSLKDNKTWVLVPKPKNTSIVDSKWIFKLKNENDSLRYKARLVAKGFTQKEGED